MPSVLVDTSVWIDAFLRPPRIDVRAVAPGARYVTCLPVIQEVLQGWRDERTFRIARVAMLAMDVLEESIDLDLIEEAIALYRASRRQGFTVRSSNDCLIAATALRHDVEVLHRDGDFEALARVSALRQRRV